jgi:hypothetical protein
MKKKTNPLQLEYVITVKPTEYDIEKEIQRIVALENKNTVWGHAYLDVGKTVGLYLAYKELKEANELMLKEQER